MKYSKESQYLSIYNTQLSIKIKKSSILRNIENLAKYLKATNFCKSQHSIYNKFHRYSTDLQSFNVNTSYQQKVYHEQKENNFEK